MRLKDDLKVSKNLSNERHNSLLNADKKYKQAENEKSVLKDKLILFENDLTKLKVSPYNLSFFENKISAFFCVYFVDFKYYSILAEK